MIHLSGDGSWCRRLSRNQKRFPPPAGILRPDEMYKSFLELCAKISLYDSKGDHRDDPPVWRSVFQNVSVSLSGSGLTVQSGTFYTINWILKLLLLCSVSSPTTVCDFLCLSQSKCIGPTLIRGVFFFPRQASQHSKVHLHPRTRTHPAAGL